MDADVIRVYHDLGEARRQVLGRRVAEAFDLPEPGQVVAAGEPDHPPMLRGQRWFR